MSQPVRFLACIAALSGAVLIGGCEEKKSQAVAPAPTAVTVSNPVEQQVSDFVEFTGNTEAFASVDVRARVKGFLKKVNFKDGATVKEGDVLFEIEPDLYQAAVDSANASLQAANARFARADADLKIKEEMARGNAASKLDVIQAQANVNTTTAEIAMATAQLKQANIDLGYTKIYSPLAGRIDKSRVDAGNLVGSDGNTLLTNIVQMTPIYVYFDVDEATVQRFQARLLKQGADLSSSEDRPKMPLSLALGANTDFPFTGIIDFADNKVDKSTGTVKLRGKLDNNEHRIAPGFFARVRVPDGQPYQAVLVPERAIGVDQGQKYVLVVNDKNVVESRPIETGTQQGRMRVVKKGLAADEWVITEGILRTRPGATVSPQKKALATGEQNQTSPSTATTRPQ
jgi:RND family efflux transporter MFP subunit